MPTGTDCPSPQLWKKLQPCYSLTWYKTGQGESFTHLDCMFETAVGGDAIIQEIKNAGDLNLTVLKFAQ